VGDHQRIPAVVCFCFYSFVAGLCDFAGGEMGGIEVLSRVCQEVFGFLMLKLRKLGFWEAVGCRVV
jgi:hypothetical protein